jgi:hypothetical protein
MRHDNDHIHDHEGGMIEIIAIQDKYDKQEEKRKYFNGKKR